MIRVDRPHANFLKGGSTTSRTGTGCTQLGSGAQRAIMGDQLSLATIRFYALGRRERCGGRSHVVWASTKLAIKGASLALKSR
jgi:hypothetical protein